MGPMAGSLQAFTPPATRSAKPVTTLVLLGALYFMSFVDRLILSLLVQPLRQDLGVTNIQAGLLFGTAFAIFYVAVSLPLARIADRYSRKRLVTIGAALWGTATVLSGLSTSFAELLALRTMLALGEAALAPAAYSMIRDLFPDGRRVQAASTFSALGILGSGCSFIIGGALIDLFQVHVVDGYVLGLRIWQLVLVAVGIPTLLLTLAFALLTSEPERQRRDGEKGHSLLHVFRVIASNFRFYGLLLIGAGLCQLPSYAMSAWLPTYLNLRFGFALDTAGYLIGPTKIISTFSGAMLVPIATEWLRRQGYSNAVATSAAVAAGVGGLAFICCGFSTNPALFLIFLAIGLFFLTGTSISVVASFQHSFAADMQGTIAALYTMSTGLLGLGLGPLLFAVVGEFGLVEQIPGLAITTVALVGAGSACALLSVSALASKKTRSSGE